MFRRSAWYPFVALASTLVLLVAVDVCLLVTCAPRANAGPRCSHCAPVSPDGGAPLARHGADANAPCCVQVTPTAAPALTAPVATPVAFEGAVLATLPHDAAGEPGRFEPPRDEAPPPTSDGFAPRAERGPPVR